MDEHPISLEALTRPFPKEAVKQRFLDRARTRQVDYVEGQTVIRRLNEVTANRWSLEVLNVTSDRVGDGELVRAHVRLTLPGLGSREHVGVQMLSKGGGEDLYKGAITDAIKKAATLFGIGLELYGPDYEGEDAAPRRQTAEPKPGPEPAAVPITAEQVTELQSLCDRAGVSAEALCKRFNRPSIPEFAPADYHVAKQGLEQLAAKANGKPAEATA